MYECFGMHDDWQFVDTISQRQTKHWNIGHVMARARTYTAKVPLLGMPTSEDTSRPSLEAEICNIVEKNSLSSIAACWNGHASALDIASVVNAFACLLFFIFHFSLSHFCLDRPFGFSIHRGIVFFVLPLFLLELPLKVVNPSGCSFLPKPPFRVFDLASIVIFSCFSFCFFILAIDHRP